MNDYEVENDSECVKWFPESSVPLAAISYTKRLNSILGMARSTEYHSLDV